MQVNDHLGVEDAVGAASALKCAVTKSHLNKPHSHKNAACGAFCFCFASAATLGWNQSEASDRPC